VNSKNCWLDRTYGDDGDKSCSSTCYSKCGSYYENTSYLCSCATHAKCVFGCPENCSGMDLEKQVCNVDCIDEGTLTVEACDT
jgi:hypothetical protein